MNTFREQSIHYLISFYSVVQVAESAQAWNFVIFFVLLLPFPGKIHPLIQWSLPKCDYCIFSTPNTVDVSFQEKYPSEEQWKYSILKTKYIGYEMDLWICRWKYNCGIYCSIKRRFLSSGNNKHTEAVKQSGTEYVHHSFLWN